MYRYDTVEFVLYCNINNDDELYYQLEGSDKNKTKHTKYIKEVFPLHSVQIT